MVRDPKEPGLEAALILERGQMGEGLRQRFLDDVLTVPHRSAHARAEAMQLGPQFPDRSEELRETSSEAY